MSVHAITHMKEDLGYSLAQASLVISLMTVAQVGGILLGWAIGDRFEKRFVAAVCMLMHAAGLLMLTYATGPVMLVAFAVLHGGGWGLRGPFMQAIRADYFGRRAIGMILGLSSLIMVGGPQPARGALRPQEGNPPGRRGPGVARREGAARPAQRRGPKRAGDPPDKTAADTGGVVRYGTSALITTIFCSIVTSMSAER